MPDRNLRRVLAVAAVLWSALLSTAMAQGEPEPQQRNIRYFTREWQFDDVNVATLVKWLARAGVELPVTLEGQVSGALSIGVPWGAINDSRAWRFGGRVSSPRFRVDSYTVENVQVRLAYRDGLLLLENLRVHVPTPNGERGRAGVISGDARMEIVPRGDLTVNVSVEGFPISYALGKIAALNPISGRFNGKIAGSVPVDSVADLQAWTAAGPLSIDALVIRDMPPATASVDIDLARGVVVGRNLSVALQQNQIGGEIRLALRDAMDWSGELELTAADLSEIRALIENFVPAESLADLRGVLGQGSLAGDVGLSGTLSPQTLASSGRVTLADVVLNPPPNVASRFKLKALPIQRIALDYRLGASALQFPAFSADLAGGSLTGSASLPLEQGLVEAAVQWTGLQPSQVVAMEVGSGATSGSLAISAPKNALSDIARWKADVNATLSELSYQGVPLTDLQTSSITLRDGRLTVPNFQANVNGDPAAIALAVQFTSPWSLEVSYDLPQLNLSIAQRVPQLAEIGQRIAGTVGTRGRVTGTWKPLDLRGDGHATARALTFDAQHRVDAVDFDYRFDRSVVTVSDFSATAYDGRITGSAEYKLGDQPSGAAQLGWAAVDLGAALRGVPTQPATLSGRSNGSLHVKIPAGSLDKLDQWTASGAADLEQLQIYDFDFRNVVAKGFRLASGILTISPIASQLDGQPVAAAVDFQLIEDLLLKVDVEAGGFQATRLAGIPYLESSRDFLRGSASTKTHLHIAFDPVVVRASGSLAVNELRTGEISLTSVRTDYQLAPESITVTGLEAALQQGRLSANATIPFDDATPGRGDLKWDGIELGEVLAKQFDLEARLAGISNGRAEVVIPASTLGAFDRWEIHASVAIPSLTANGQQIAAIDANVDQADRRLVYAVGGSLLGGRLTLQGERPKDLPADGLAALGSARLSLRSADLTAAAPFLYGQQASEHDLRGTVDLQLRTSAASNQWSWRGSVGAANVVIDQTQLTPALRLQLAGDERRVILEQASGQFAGGELSGGGEWGIASRGPRTFRVRLRSAELQRLARLGGSAADSDISGRIDLDLRARPGEVWRMNLTALSPRASLGGFDVGNVTVPLSVDWSPVSGRLALSTTGAQLALAGGRLAGRLTANNSSGWTIDGGFRFSRVDVSGLTGSDSGFATGKLTGTLDVKARNAHSVDDIQATLLADLEDTQARGIPVLEGVQRVVPGAGLSGISTFGEGRVEARLANSIVRVSQLSLASKQLQLFITGQFSLAGRLRLDAIAATGQTANPVVAENLLVRLVAVPAAPAALLLEINELLSNRVIHLAITGTLDRPIIRVRWDPLESTCRHASLSIL